MPIKIRKFRDIVEAQAFLDGGISGGQPQFPIYGLVGKAITLTAPNAAVTFVAGADPSGSLTFKEIKTQAEAAISGLRVLLINGSLWFINSTLAAAVTMAAADEPARALLGFANNKAYTGRLYAAPGGSAPAFIQAYAANDGSHTVYTLET
jgi:hypothetical protein